MTSDSSILAVIYLAHGISRCHTNHALSVCDCILGTRVRVVTVIVSIVYCHEGRPKRSTVGARWVNKYCDVKCITQSTGVLTRKLVGVTGCQMSRIMLIGISVGQCHQRYHTGGLLVVLMVLAPWLVFYYLSFVPRQVKRKRTSQKTSKTWPRSPQHSDYR